MIKFSATAEVVSREELRKGGMEKKEEVGRRGREGGLGRQIKEERRRGRRAEGKEKIQCGIIMGTIHNDSSNLKCILDRYQNAFKI